MQIITIEGRAGLQCTRFSVLLIDPFGTSAWITVPPKQKRTHRPRNISLDLQVSTSSIHPRNIQWFPLFSGFSGCKSLGERPAKKNSSTIWNDLETLLCEFSGFFCVFVFNKRFCLMFMCFLPESCGSKLVVCAKCGDFPRARY